MLALVLTANAPVNVNPDTWVALIGQVTFVKREITGRYREMMQWIPGEPIKEKIELKIRDFAIYEVKNPLAQLAEQKNSQSFPNLISGFDLLLSNPSLILSVFHLRYHWSLLRGKAISWWNFSQFSLSKKGRTLYE